jgi:hypothetical protein
LVPVEGVYKERVKKAEYVKILCTHVWKWKKMKPIKIILEMGEGRIKENNGGVNLTKMYF